MTGYTVSSTPDGYTIWRPRTPRAGRRGVLLMPGQGNPTMYVSGTIQAASMRMAAALAGAGIPCITSAFGGNSWANDAAMTAMTNAWAALRAAFPGMPSDKVCLYGTSMGAAQITRYAQLNPTKVAALVGIIPAYDPKAAYINGDIGDAAMEAAWGFSGLANFPTGLDLASHAEDAEGIPILTGYASNDDLVSAASVTAYHTAVGGLPGNLVNLGALGHTDPAIAAMPVAKVGKFLAEHGA